MSSSPTPTPPTPKVSSMSGKANRLVEISHAVHDVRREQVEKALQDAMEAEVAGSGTADRQSQTPTPAASENLGEEGGREGAALMPNVPPAKERTTIASFVFGSDWAEKVVRGDYPEPTTPVRQESGNEHLQPLSRKGKEAALPGRKRARVLSEDTIGEDVMDRVRTDFPPPYQAPPLLDLGTPMQPRQHWPVHPQAGNLEGFANANAPTRMPHGDFAALRDRTPVMGLPSQTERGHFAPSPQPNLYYPQARQSGPPPPQLMPMHMHPLGDAHAASTLGLDPPPFVPTPPLAGAMRSDHILIPAELYDALIRRQTATAPMSAWPTAQNAQGDHARAGDQTEPAPYRTTSTTGAQWPNVPTHPQTLPLGPGRLDIAHAALDARMDCMDIDGIPPPTTGLSQTSQAAREDAASQGSRAQRTGTTVNLLIEAGRVLCTPRPRGGFPVPEGRGPFDALRHASASRLAAWKTYTSARRFLFDVVGKLSFTETEATDITSYVEGRLHQLTGEHGAVLLPPEPRRQDVPKEDGPSAWMACGYSEHATAVIVEHGVLSYDANNTFIIYSGSHPPPTYILTLEGLTQKIEDPIKAAVYEVLAKEDVRKLTAQIVGATPRCPGIDPMTVIDTLPGSLRIKMTRLKNNRVVAHIYLEPPTKDPRAWDAWRNLLRAQEYKHVLLPETVRVRPPQRCFACHAADHDVDVCPLPQVEGWRGPTLQELVTRAETEPMPAADHAARGAIAQPSPRWPQTSAMRGGMHAGPSSGVPRSQRNPNRTYGRN